MSAKHYFFILLSALPWLAPAQKPEAGFFAGGSYYLGDLNPGRHFQNTRPALGLVYRHIFNPFFALKQCITYATLAGDDAKTNRAYMKQRNLHFRSRILELSAHLEFNFLPFEEKVSKHALEGEFEYLFVPYVFAGFSLFSFNPQAQVNGVWYDLQPLGTEGQGAISYPERKKYSLARLAIPFGAGIKFSIASGINFALEWGLRRTFTDYLDDVSTTYPDPDAIAAEKGNIARKLSDPSLPDPAYPSGNTGRARGNSRDKDWFAFTGAMLTFKWETRFRKQLCPPIE